MRLPALLASVTCLLGAAACDDGASRPAVVPASTATASARESRDPPPAKPVEVIDNTVAAKTTDGGTGATDAGAPHKADGGLP